MVEGFHLPSSLLLLGNHAASMNSHSSTTTTRALSSSSLLLSSDNNELVDAEMPQTTERATTNTIVKTEEEWKEMLTPEQYYVLREEGTERPNSSELNFVQEDGVFVCAGCDNPLFTTTTKFDSGTGWPSFYAPIDNKDTIEVSTDYKLILPRTEVHCANCKGHLGHVFDDGPEPTGQRFCMNGIAMKFYSSTGTNPEFVQEMYQRQSNNTNPYKPSMSQILPGTILNALIGCFFFASFTTALESNGGMSFLTIFPLLPAIYYGVLAVNSLKRVL